jgi:RNA polymerase sigma-70 factor, ECF subfamily
MSEAPASAITRLLKAWGGGDQDALERLTPLIYQELHRLARHYMKRESDRAVLQTSALINEAYMRLVDVREVDWQDRAHFLGVAARLMRRILVDFARSRGAVKRGGDLHQVPLDTAAELTGDWTPDLVDLDEALRSLASLDPRQSEVVELRFFGGLSIEETAATLKVSPGTVRRDWRIARAWLYRQLTGT